MLLADGLVLIGTDEGIVYAFEAETGKVRWKFRAGSTVASDILRSGGSVYAVSSKDQLLCLDLQSGRLRWSFTPPTSLAEKPDMLRTSPAVSGGRVFFGGQDGNVYAFEAETGTVDWIQDLGSPALTGLVVSGQRVYVGTGDDALHVLDKASGAVQQRVPLGGQPYGLALLAEDSLLVFTAWMSESSELLCLNPGTGQIRWRQKPPPSGDWHTARPYRWKDAVLAGTQQGDFFAFRLADGSQEWSARLEGEIRVFGSAENVLYVGTVKGTLYACDLSAFP
jgi:eukaryotic-like serine/threonine-protein kinase